MDDRPNWTQNCPEELDSSSQNQECKPASQVPMDTLPTALLDASSGHLDAELLPFGEAFGQLLQPKAVETPRKRNCLRGKQAHV